MSGKIKFAIIMPPIIKQMVATNDGHCKLDKPIIEWPEVHPPAYLVPKPMRNPPTIIITKPLTVNKADQLKTSGGASLLKSSIPYPLSSLTSFGFTFMG